MKTTLLVLLLSLILLSSCQPELDIELGNDPPPPAANGTVLWKYVETDTTLAAGLDTVEMTLYEYDNQKRISHITFYIREDTPSTPVYSYTSEIDFFYNGSDTLAFKRIAKSWDDEHELYDTSYYVYQNGKVSSDSNINISKNLILGPSFDIIHKTNTTYTIAGNIITKQTRAFFPFSSCIDEVTHVMTYTNGNISSQNLTISPVCGGSGTADGQMTYDNNINPFFKTIIPYPIVFLNSDVNTQRNNLTRKTSAGFSQDYRFAYTYRHDGYPLVVRKNYSNNYYSKGLYYYKE